MIDVEADPEVDDKAAMAMQDMGLTGRVRVRLGYALVFVGVLVLPSEARDFLADVKVTSGDGGGDGDE